MDREFFCNSKPGICTSDVICVDCEHFTDGTTGYYIKQPITNADHIRGMSDEELAEYLSEAYFLGLNHGMKRPPKVEQHKYTLDWLRQPWEGNNG